MSVIYPSGTYPHPFPLCESESLSNVPLPICPEPDIPDNGIVLSSPQMDSVRCAKLQFSKPMYRGFFLGDATGVGKGRTIAGIIFDQALQVQHNHPSGKFKAVWVSLNSGLEQISIDEIQTVQTIIPTLNLQQIDDDTDKTFSNYQWRYTTYTKMKESTKYNNIVDWLSSTPHSLIIFDEVHTLKNIKDNIINKLFEHLPKIAVVYSSATPLFKVDHMKYMKYLELWGSETSSFKTFYDFKKALGTSGLAAMEMLSLELQRQGKYLSRTLSFDGMNVSTLNIILNRKQRKLYNDSCKLWEEIINSQPSGTSFRQTVWGKHLSYFKDLITQIKTSHTIPYIAERLKNPNNTIVVGLQKTGGCSYYNMKNGVVDEHIPNILFHNLMSIIDFLQPNEENSLVVDKINAFVNYYKGFIEDVLPLNATDAIRIYCEKNNISVGEITGRKQRLHYNSDTQQMEIISRSSNTMNKWACEEFQKNNLRVIIISAAGSSGISLHSTDPNIHRIYISVELPYSTDAFIQQLGRTHRSSQANISSVVFSMTNIPGEMRFYNSLIRRLNTLGAMTQGDRDSSSMITKHISSMMLSNTNVMKKILRKMFHYILFKNAYNVIRETMPHINDFTNCRNLSTRVLWGIHDVDKLKDRYFCT